MGDRTTPQVPRFHTSCSWSSSCPAPDGAPKRAASGNWEDLNLHHATVHKELDTGYIACILRGEEDDYFRNLVRMTHAAKGNRPHHPSLQPSCLFLILREPVDSWCVNRPRAYDIDANLAVFEFVCPCAGKGTDSRLGGAIDAERRHTFDGNNIGIKHNVCAVGHERKSLLHGEKNTLHVGVEGLVEVFFGDLIDGGKLTSSCIGEQSIDVPELLLDLGEELVEVCEFAGVRLDTGCARADLLDGGVEHFLATAGNDNFWAFRNEPLCGSKTDTRG